MPTTPTILVYVGRSLTSLEGENAYSGRQNPGTLESVNYSSWPGETAAGLGGRFKTSVVIGY